MVAPSPQWQGLKARCYPCILSISHPPHPLANTLGSTSKIPLEFAHLTLCPNYLFSYLSESCSVVFNSLQPHGLYSPWNSPGQNTGVGSLSLLPGIFLTQKSNQGLLYCRQILYQLSYEGSLL